MAITIHIPRWRVHAAFFAGTLLASIGLLTEKRCDAIAAWVASGAKARGPK